VGSGSDGSRKPIGHKDKPFIQPMTAVIRNHGQLTPAELAVLLDVSSYDWSGQGTWVAQKTVADDLGIGERTVRDALRKLEQVGAIERQRRPGQSNLYTVNKVWVPADPGNIRRGRRSNTAPPTPADPARDPGNIRRTHRQILPHAPAAFAAEVDSTNYIQQVEATTDNVPPPAASEGPLSGTIPDGSQEQGTEEKLEAAVAERIVPQSVISPEHSSASLVGMEAVAKSRGSFDYSSARPDLAEEAQVVQLATRFDQIQAMIGNELATGIRWQKSLKGFRIMLFSDKHRRPYADVCLVLDYLKDNPLRAKEIVNKDKKRGVTNTYHLMFLFDRLLDEAVGPGSETERMFSKRKICIPVVRS